MLRSKYLLSLLIAGLLGIYALVGITQYRQYRELDRVMRQGDINAMWAFAQLALEYERLSLALYARVTRPEDNPGEELLLRYDVFVSRIGIIDGGTPKSLMEKNPIYQRAMRELTAFADLADSVRMDAPPQQLRPVQEKLMDMRETIREVAYESQQATGQLIDARTRVLQGQTREAAIVTALQGLLTLLLALAMAYQFRKRERAKAQALEAQNALVESLRRNEEALEARVQERTADLRSANESLRLQEGELVAARATAEESSQMKSNFLANMSHEIRSPLNAVIGMGHLILATDLSPQQRDYAEKIQRSGQHLLALINDILDFSKIEAGRMEVESVDFALQSVLDGLSDLMGAKAAAKGLELAFDIAPDMPSRLKGDPLRLGQILINYVSNAVKFTAKGNVVVHASHAPLDDGQLMLRFEVHDTGIGLTPEQLASLFQSFQQADNSITRKFGGTGLGLAISKHLAQIMGGEVGASSVAGMGSIFWFTARVGTVEAAKPILQTVPDLRGRRVLVVDDNEMARQVLSGMLQQFGFSVEEAPSGPQALALAHGAEARNQPYDIAFLDWQMPEMDGIATARALASLARPPRPVIVTAHGREDVFHEVGRAGIDFLLLKPVNPSLLFDAAMRALHGQGSAEPLRVPARLAPHASREVLRGAKVLLVDDIDLNQQVGSELLQDVGIEVDIAGDGQEALDKLARKAYDLVLMDMQMPVMDGLTATRRIRENAAWAALPVIAMTANAMPIDRARCLEAGMNDHLPKPIDPAALYQALQRWLPARAVGVQEPSAGRGASPEGDSAPPPVGLDAVPAPLLAIEGLDVASALPRLQHRVDRYENMLQRFVKGQADAVPQARLAMSEGRQADALRILHTLKGTSATIGAMGLSRQAEAAEKALQNGAPAPDLDPLLGATAQSCAGMVAALQAALEAIKAPAAADAGTAQPHDAEQAREALRRIMALVEQDDPDAAERLQQSEALLRRHLGNGFEPLAESIANYDFDTGRELLRHHLSADSPAATAG